MSILNSFLSNIFSEKYTCELCGSKMEFIASRMLKCTKCNCVLDLDKDDEYPEIYDDDKNDIPECCKACGGPYPQCMISCKIFDD